MAAIYYDCHAFCANELVCIHDALHMSHCAKSSFPPPPVVDRGKIPRFFARELINGSRLKSEIAPVSGAGCVISRHGRK